MSTVEWYAHAIQCESPLSGLDLSGIFQTYIFVSPELNKYQLIFEGLKCADLHTGGHPEADIISINSLYFSWKFSSHLLHWLADGPFCRSLILLDNGFVCV